MVKINFAEFSWIYPDTDRRGVQLVNLGRVFTFCLPATGTQLFGNNIAMFAGKTLDERVSTVNK